MSSIKTFIMASLAGSVAGALDASLLGSNLALADIVLLAAIGSLPGGVYLNFYEEKNLGEALLFYIDIVASTSGTYGIVKYGSRLLF